MDNSPFSKPSETLRPTGESKPTGQMALGCLIPFLSIFFFVGLGVLYFLTISPILHWQKAQNWVGVPCRVVSSQIITKRDSDGDRTYKADIAYTYTYQGQTFTDNTYSHAQPSSGSYGGAQKRVAQYPVGATITCYVDPTNPSEAVLNNGFDTAFLFGLFGLLFMLIPAIVLTSSMRSGFGRKKPNAKWSPSSSEVISASPSGGIVLRAQNGSLVSRMLVLWAITLFWNGIIAVFIYQELRHLSGFSLFMGLFFIPFLIVGLILLAFAIGSIGAFFNPRPILSFSAAEVRPGEQLQVNYELRGGFTRPQNLSITLEGREEATFVQGTSTSTSKSPFYYEQLLETSSQIAAGSFAIQIPPHTMHSFESPNNKIVWLVTLKAPIKGWPDIKEEWKLNVLPGR